MKIEIVEDNEGRSYIAGWLDVVFKEDIAKEELRTFTTKYGIGFDSEAWFFDKTWKPIKNKAILWVPCGRELEFLHLMGGDEKVKEISLHYVFVRPDLAKN